MVLKVKKIVSIILACVCVSAGNAMNSKQDSSDNIAMQHTLLNILQVIEDTKDPALNNIDSIAGMPMNLVSNFFKLDDYEKSPKGIARKFFNDIISVLVNCEYEDVNVNGLANNEHYKKLKNIFNEMISTDYNNLTSAKNKMSAILEQSKSIFFEICKIVKNENNQQYNFINYNYVNDNDYRDLQFKLGRTFLKKKLNNTEWNNNEILLHKSLLLVLYCEKLIMDLSLFPKDFPSTNSIIGGYWDMIFKNFEFNASPYFK